jgi:hypothetical protein
VVPFAVFTIVFLLCVPGVLFSPKEFGFGFAQVFLAQGAHRRPLPFTISLVYLARSMGPLAVAMAAGGVLWALSKLRRWDGSDLANGIALVTAWALAYGALVLFAFARLPSYVDLWVPPLAVLAASAWVGEQGGLRRSGARVAVLTAVLLMGVWAHGADSLARGIFVEGDGRQGAARWMEAHAADEDTVLADEAVLVPDRLRHVWWNWWGEPARAVYDETKTWGTDPVWPSWGGGHRRLVFENAKWAQPDTLLARRPRWVMTSNLWRDERASDSSLAGFDRRLDSGEAGYRERARLTPIRTPLSGWGLLLRGPRAPALFGGLEVRIYEREEAASPSTAP